MSASNQLHRLANLTSRIETSSLDLLQVTPSSEPSLPEESLTVNLTAQVPRFPDDIAEEVSIVDAEITPDGTLELELEATVDPEADDASDSAQPSQTESGQGDTATTRTRGGESAKPAYKDPERLEEVYETHDTFPEMKQALDADVTAETIRLHMVEHGIHEPESVEPAEPRRNGTDSGGEDDDDIDTAPSQNGHGETADDQPGTRENGDSPEPEIAIDQDALDQVELPEGVSIDDVREAAKTARTVYEVQIKLDVDRERARQLLQDLNLLDIVLGRVKDAAEKEVTVEEINDRIQDAVS